MDKIDPNKDKLITDFPYFQAPNLIFDQDNGLDIYAKMVYLYLCRCGNNGASAFPSKKTIAEKTKMGKRTVDSAIKTLQKKGLIKYTKRFKKGKKENKSNLYKVFPPEKIEKKGGAHDAPGGGAHDAPGGAHDAPGGGAHDAPNKELKDYKEINIKQQSSFNNNIKNAGSNENTARKHKIAAAFPNKNKFINSKINNLFKKVFDEEISLVQAKELENFNSENVIFALKELEKRENKDINSPIKYIKPIIEDFEKKGKKNYPSSKKNQSNKKIKLSEDWNNEITEQNSNEHSDKIIEFRENFKYCKNYFFEKEAQKKFFEITGSNMTKEENDFLKKDYDELKALERLNNVYTYYMKREIDKLNFFQLFYYKDDSARERFKNFIK